MFPTFAQNTKHSDKYKDEKRGVNMSRGGRRKVLKEGEQLIELTES